MSNAMFVSKLDSRINDLIESGKVAVDSATEKTSKHGTATRFVCTFDAEHAAGLFDETTGVNANKLTDRDQFAPVTLPLSFMDAEVSDPKFNFHGADLIELSVYGWKKRSEERRVGKEWRYRRGTEHETRIWQETE